MRRPGLLLAVAALSACSSQSPSGPDPGPLPTPVPTPTPQAALPFEGRHELVIAVAPECRDQFPAAFRHKVYSVRLTTASNRTLLAFDNPLVFTGIGFVAEGFLTQVGGRDWLTLRLFFHEDFVNPDDVHESYGVGGEAQGFLERGQAQGHFLGQLSYSGTSLGQYAACTSGAHDFLFRPL